MGYSRIETLYSDDSGSDDVWVSKSLVDFPLAVVVVRYSGNWAALLVSAGVNGGGNTTWPSPAGGYGAVQVIVAGSHVYLDLAQNERIVRVYGIG